MDLKIALVCSTLWMGFVLAISFFETPIRFSAPFVDLKIGVSIGRLLFKNLHRLEGAFFIISLGLLMYKNRSYVFLISLGGLLLVWVIQKILLRTLDQRALQLFSGQVLHPSFHHRLYVLLEVIKLMLLSGHTFLILKKI